MDIVVSKSYSILKIQKGESAKYIYLRGTGFNNTMDSICMVNDGFNETTRTSTSRGLTLILINRTTLEIASLTSYDVYGESESAGLAKCNELATAINNASSSYFVCVISYDAVRWNDNLINALKSCGCGGIPDQTAYRVPYAFIGYKGLAEGYAMQAQSTQDANAAPAEIIAYVANGALAVTRDGKDGQRGKTGRFYYYACDWNSSDNTTQFAVTDISVPYFSKAGSNSNEYYVYNPDDMPVSGQMTMAEMAAATTVSGSINWNSKPWEIMTSDFRYLITEAIFGAYAHFGAFIINGDWLISQYGTYGGSTPLDYTKFDPAYPKDSVYGTHTVNGTTWTGYNFVPNFAVDGLTGKSYQNAAYIKGQVIATSGEFSGTFRAGNSTIIGNLDLADTQNGMTVFDDEHVPRINLQPKPISSIATVANDTYMYYPLQKTQSGASSFNVTTGEQSFSLAKYENLDIDKFTVQIYFSGSGTVYPSSYYTYLTIVITHPTGQTTNINVTTSMVDSYGNYRNLTTSKRFVAPVAGTYSVKFIVSNSSNWTSGQTLVSVLVNARYQSSKDTQVYIAKDGFYAHAGANKLIWAGENETQIRYGFNGIRWNDADMFDNMAMEVVAGYKGNMPNAKPLWLPFYNYTPIFQVGVGATPYLFTSQYIGNISETKYAFIIDPYRDRGICLVVSGYRDSSFNEQESWIVLPSPNFTDGDGESAQLPVGYTVTVINWTGTNIYVVPYSSSNHGAVTVDGNRNNNYYCGLNGTQSRDTYIYVGSMAGLGYVWQSIHDTQ